MKLDGADKTPYVELNESGVLILRGRSIPEDSISFYEPILKWVQNYCENPAANTEIRVELEYFNTSSSKCILDVFKAIKPAVDKSNVVVKWHYEEDDDDMLEAGEDYEAISGLKFEMVAVDEL